MENVTYRQLTLEESDRLSEINPSQFIKRIWQEVNGKLTLVDFNKQLDSWPAPFEMYLNKFKKTMSENGGAFGAFDENEKLIGYATINHDFFGEKYKHILLDCLFITGIHQNKGIGKKLFKLCAEKAKDWGADKIYICAASAERTIGFYHMLGCKEAQEVNAELYAFDPTDLQLEYSLY